MIVGRILFDGMNKTCIAAALLLAPVIATSQIVVSGQTAVQFYKSAATTSPRSMNSGRPSFGLESDLFLDGYVNDNVAGLVNARVLDNGSAYFDYVAIRLANLTPLNLNILAGKFDLPFGNLGERIFPRQNPLFGLPVLYDYRTALPARVTTERDILAAEGSGSGMYLLDGGIYDIGMMVCGSFGIVDYAVAVTSGTISETSYGGGNTNSDFGKLIRLAVTPFVGLTVGGAYAWGPYLEETSTSLPRAIDVNTYNQRAMEFDIEFSRGYGVLNAEGVYSTYQVPLETNDETFRVLGFSVEGKYTVMPRLYLALRLSGMHFGEALLGGTEQPWDYDVTEFEGGLGYFLYKDVLLKLVRRETRIHGTTMPKDNLTVLQLVVAY
ncbi:MAG: hypothetical protein WB699_16615 [Bacteroidota bacterium]